MQDDDIDSIKILKGKVLSNVQYHERLTDQLGDVEEVDAQDQHKTDAEFERCNKRFWPKRT